MDKHHHLVQPLDLQFCSSGNYAHTIFLPLPCVCTLRQCYCLFIMDANSYSCETTTLKWLPVYLRYIDGLV